MFSSGPNYSKLKTNLRLSINRLKLLEKKKTELAQKARKEIADYLGAGKTERAKIRVEHIIREDYLVEAMEVTEMYCDLLLARYGLIQQMKDLDEGLSEAISSLIWVCPRLQTDVQEIKIVADQLALKYGKPYAQACREQQVSTISEKLIHKLSVQAPPKVLVEKYLVEIANIYNVEYEPDPQVMRESDWVNDPLIKLDEPNNLSEGSNSAASNMNIPFPHLPQSPQPFNYPPQVYKPMNYPNLPPNMNADTEKLPPNFTPSIFLTNPQSLTNCFPEFSNQVSKLNPDIVAVTETWFSERNPAGQFTISGYSVFNDDRDSRRGGGVALYIKQNLEPYEPTIKIPLELECVWVGIGENLFICGLYNPPRSNGKLLLDHIVNSVLDLRRRISNCKVIVVGDFNKFPHERLYSSLNLINLVQEPTHMNSSIDLILTDVPEMYNKPLLLPPIGRSQHNCIMVTSCFGPNAGFRDEFVLPSVPGEASYNPPPADPGADSMASNRSGCKWDERLGPDNSPPPAYTPVDQRGPTAPYPTQDAGPLPPKDQYPTVNPSAYNRGNFKDGNQPKPSPRSKFDDTTEFNLPELPTVPDLPSVPAESGKPDDDIDFDDLNRRFENLKKK